MRQDKQNFYDRNGKQRHLEGLNEKLEKTLQEKQDAEHFLRVLAPKYIGVYVVDLVEDTVRPIIMPDYFRKALEDFGGSFRTAGAAYRDSMVAPADWDAFSLLFDYDRLRSRVLNGDIVELDYTKTDGSRLHVKVTPYSSNGIHVNETIWIFADKDATLTPPPKNDK